MNIDIPIATTISHFAIIGGRYRLLRQLGRGASAIVHLAEDGLSGTQVAIKVLDDAPTNDAEAAM